jgi:hypothetical protein
MKMLMCSTEMSVDFQQTIQHYGPYNWKRHNQCCENPKSETGVKTLNNIEVTSFVRLEVFTAVTMQNGVFWDVTPCGSWYFFAACVGC